METQAQDFWKLFKPVGCSVKLKGATKEEVFDELIGNLVQAKMLSEKSAKTALRALAERERLASTGVGRNVAIPHVKISGLDSVVVSLSIHPEGVDWEALDGDQVNIFFTVLRPATAGDQHDPERHLEMMQWISRLCRDADFRRFATRASTRTELVDLLKEMAQL